MPTDAGLRVYATVRTTPVLRELYGNTDEEALHESLADYTRALLEGEPYRISTPELLRGFKVVDAPSKDWGVEFVGDRDCPDLEPDSRPAAPPVQDELIIVYEFVSASAQDQFLDAVRHGQTEDSDPPISGAGVDLAAGPADHWCPGTISQESFGTRTNARRTVAADALRAAGFRGRRVNVVIVDEGLHEQSFELANWGGGLVYLPLMKLPGTARRTSHGMTIARTILDIAPEAVLYDVPLIPEDRIGKINPFLSLAHAAFWQLFWAILIRRLEAPFAGPWIVVNAWAIFDRATETSPGNYTENKASDHPLIRMVRLLTDLLGIDVIFAAGNCGEFCASPRCGKLDQGPGRSIWGANALPEVVTVGAVSCAETWIGYSSQGPGPGVNRLGRQKPDLCAPSNFLDDLDAAILNSGTSTACAMVAGVVAALRSNPNWYQSLVSPGQLHNALTSSARQIQTPGWNERTGHGIIDAEAAMGTLPP